MFCCDAGSPLVVSIADGSDVMTVVNPTEPALVDCTNYVTVNKNQQTERIDLLQCLVKVTGVSVCVCPSVCLCVCLFTLLVVCVFRL